MKYCELSTGEVVVLTDAKSLSRLLFESFGSMLRVNSLKPS